MQLLHQEIEPSPAGLLAIEHAADLGEVGIETVEFLVDIGALQQERDLLLEAGGLDGGAEFDEPGL